jgi:ADP-ribose pyrophosphatase
VAEPRLPVRLPGRLDEKLHLFVAEELTAGEARPEPDEQLEPVIVPLADAVRMCLDGTIRDAKTVTSLLLWERMQKALATDEHR